MVIHWYPPNKEELKSALKKYLNYKRKADRTKQVKEIHGIIVPHAGYEFSGQIAGKAYALLKGKKFKRVVILGPSHYKGFFGINSLEEIETPLGPTNIEKNEYEKIEYEHSVQNQVPFVQTLFPKAKILPLVVGQISLDFAEFTARELTKEKDTLFIISTDLSHFLPYDKAVERDKRTISIIENLDFKAIKEIDACGIFPLLIGLKICEQKGYKPKLIEYKNSGDITGDKSSVVGYASFYF